MKRPGFLFLLVLLIAVIGFLFFNKDRTSDNDLIVGAKAPTFTAQTQAGQSLSLAQLKGKLILLDFWGSWCVPCRKEHPQLVKLYETYYDKKLKKAEQFTIISVALEQDSVNWKKAIQKDQLSWPFQVMESISTLDEVSTPIAKRFGVEQVPSRFLINEKGVIVGMDQSIDQLEKVLKNY